MSLRKKVLLTLISICFIFSAQETEDQFSQKEEIVKVLKPIEEKAIEGIINKLDKKYADIKLSGQFEEKLYNPFLDKYEYFSGKFKFMSDNYFSIETFSPNELEIVCDSEYIYIYIPEDKEVTKMKLTEVSDINFISQFIPVGHSYSDYEFQFFGDKKYIYLTMQSKQDSYFSELEYLLDKKTLLPQYCALKIIDGTEIEIYFSSIKKDRKIKSADFEFKIPEGVNLISDEITEEEEIETEEKQK